MSPWSTPEGNQNFALLIHQHMHILYSLPLCFALMKGGVFQWTLDCPTSVLKQKQACWEAGRTSSWLENFMQWKQLARAGRRKSLLSESDPVRPAEGKSWQRNRKHGPGHSGGLIGKYSTVGLNTGVQKKRHREWKGPGSYCYTGSCSVMLREEESEKWRPCSPSLLLWY